MTPRPSPSSGLLRRAAAWLVVPAVLALAPTPGRAQVGWEPMLEGTAFVAYTRQTSTRGIDGPAAWGWMHGSLGRAFAHGSVSADAMVTLEDRKSVV